MILKRFKDFKINESNSNVLDYEKIANNILDDIMDERGIEDPNLLMIDYKDAYDTVTSGYSDLENATEEDFKEVAKFLTSLTSGNMNENISINEAVLQKDLDRMQSIVKKSGGDKEKMMNYAVAMANAIKDKHKAFQRGKAADEIIKDKEIADVFYIKAQELGLDFNINVERSKSGMSKFGIDVPKLGSRMSPPNEEPQKNRWEPNSILPIGSVNIQTGESNHFNIYNTWPDSTAEVWKDEKDNYKLVFTAGSTPIHNIGWKSNFRHNSTWNEIGRDWEMVEWVNVKNLKELLRMYNKTSMRGYVYK